VRDRGRHGTLLRAVRADNAKGEYYLTDLVALARGDGARVAAVQAPYAELRGINSRAELADAEAMVQSWLRAAALDGGVTMTDPASVFLAADTELESDVTIGPNVVFGQACAWRRGRRSARSPIWKAATSARAASSARMRACVPARCWRPVFMSATSSS